MRQKTNRPPKKSVPSVVCRRCPALFCAAVSILRCLLLRFAVRPAFISANPCSFGRRPFRCRCSGAAAPARSVPFPCPPIRNGCPRSSRGSPGLRSHPSAPGERRKRSPKLLPRRPLRGVAADGRGAASRPGRRCVRRESGSCRRAAVPDARVVRAGCGPARGLHR